MDNPPDPQTPNPLPLALPRRVTALSLIRQRDAEKVNRPQYAKWAKQLVEGKPLRVVTTYERAICFIPSSAFPDNGDMPTGTLIVCYGGGLYQGYVELDFTKSPNPFFLKSKGFPMNIGVLICQTIYAMFPHLNPLTEADLESLRTSHPNKKQKLLRLTAPKSKKSAKKTKEPAAPQVEAPPPQAPAPVSEVVEVLPPETKPETEPKIETASPEAKPTKDHANRSPKQRKTRKTRNTLGTHRQARNRRKTKLPDVQG